MPDNVYRIAKKKDIQDVKAYLRSAKTNDFAPPAWGHGRWLYGHGEGRSTSRETYHIGFMIQSDDDHHITCLFIRVRGTNRKLVAKDSVTEKDWGAEQPSPEEVLMFYKKEWGVDDSGDEDNKD
ncbi:hypothetical protein FGADI_12796 [Fusarium gaditjirri]|uniref:Uncharacterized protein n=1 Tax=Fusarium gaditjirri TaxID=282569 RepID=A0A8H4WNA7_9HYPO|nr:hypothetical protein FGADI_12796 [Fusarium gaditjirri]